MQEIYQAGKLAGILNAFIIYNETIVLEKKNKEYKNRIDSAHTNNEEKERESVDNLSK